MDCKPRSAGFGPNIRNVFIFSRNLRNMRTGTERLTALCLLCSAGARNQCAS